MASRAKTRPRTKSKLQRDEVHDDAGLGPDENSHEEQSGQCKDELMSKL